MTVPGPGDLYAAAETLRDVAAAALVDTPGGPIGFQAVTQGAPSFDCPPALYVNIGAAIVAETAPMAPVLAPQQRIVTTGIVNLVAFTITVIRCVSTIETEGQNPVFPSAAELEADAQVCYADVWAVWNALVRGHLAGTLFQTESGRREFSIDPAIPVRTEGGAGGWMLTVRVQIPGFACPIA